MPRALLEHSYGPDDSDNSQDGNQNPNYTRDYAYNYLEKQVAGREQDQKGQALLRKQRQTSSHIFSLAHIRKGA
jgi:hypothetical protein